MFSSHENRSDLNIDWHMHRICTTAVRFLTRNAQADSQRVMTFSNEEDVVFFRHHIYEKQGAKDVILQEVGPRFEMQLYQLRLGTLDQVRLGTRSCGRITALRNNGIIVSTRGYLPAPRILVPTARSPTLVSLEVKRKAFTPCMDATRAWLPNRR